MGSTFTATASVDLFANPSHTVALSYFTTFDLLPFPHFETHFDFGFDGGDLPRSGDPVDAMKDTAVANGSALYFFDVFAGNAVNYSLSTAPVFIDLERSTQHGGFAEGDRFFDGTMTGIDGSSFDDVIRGIDVLNNPEGIFTVFNNPGVNIFNGGGGDDLLEGRGGADTLNGQGGFDLASYESSSAPVSVRLAGVNGDTQTALASGGDATGDKLSSIEGLIGSGGGDQLTGNSLDNLLAGGLGSDVLNGMNGTDTVDYSRDHFFDAGDTADRVEVHLGLGGANGTGDEFKLQGDGTFKRVSTDTLTSIENVTGTAGSDIIVGNELDNMLEGRGGSNVLDGGLGDDSLIGGSGIDTADYTSHDSMAVQRGEQYVIALGVIGRPGSFTLTSSPLPGVSQVVESDVLIGIENVTGSNHAETITGNELANTLDGRGGSDTIDGGFGDDILIGNGGTDTASFLSHDGLDGGSDVISLGNGTTDGSYTRFQALGPIRRVAETDVLRSIENVTGSTRDEVITGNDGGNVLDGRGGNDILDGGAGNDVIIGGDGIDTASYESHDAVAGVFGGDVISLGQNGADGSYTRLGIVSTPTPHIGAVETDVLRGIENVTGSNRIETINGNEQDNTLAGRGGNDTVNGGAGNDTYDFTGGGLGTDTFFDESGTSDRVLINSFNDILPGFNGITTGRDGNDLVVVLTTGTFRIVDHFNGHQIETIVASDTGQSMVLANGLTGGNGNGIIAGTHKGETLDGRGGDDFLFAGNGRDRVIGGDGNDRLNGGGGPDTFVFGPGFGHDVVTDFGHADHIEFDGGVFQNFNQVQAASHQVGADTVITLDADDSITLLGVTLSSLHASHFDFV